LLILAAPILLVSVLLLLFIHRGSPFFVQRRTGRHGERFALYKLASMRNTAPQLSLPDHERTTPLGKVIRAYAIDELPQLLNVLKGDMSLIGPRPLLPEYLALYNDRQMRRHEVRPGLTGLAQIHGRNNTDWPSRLEWDVRYVEQLSPALDLHITLRTIGLLLCGKGRHTQMPRFTGNP